LARTLAVLASLGHSQSEGRLGSVAAFATLLAVLAVVGYERRGVTAG